MLLVLQAGWPKLTGFVNREISVKKFILGAALLAFGGCLENQAPHTVSDVYSPEFNIETLAENLNKPWGIAVLPGGGYLVTEIDGGINLVEDGEVTKLSGGPSDLFYEGQGGLFGVTLAPDFDSSGKVYFAYAYGNSKQNGTAVFRAELSDKKLLNGETVFRANPPKDTGAHFGGRLLFLPDGTMILSTGDGFTYREAAQDENSDLGKTLIFQTDEVHETLENSS